MLTTRIIPSWHGPGYYALAYEGGVECFRAHGLPSHAAAAAILLRYQFVLDWTVEQGVRQVVHVGPYEGKVEYGDE